MCEASCLPGRILRFKWKRDRLCFLSHRDFAFGLSLPLCWLVERVSKKPYHVFPFSLHFLCTKSKMHIFFPLHREMLGKENVQNLSARSSVSSAAELSHSRQAGSTLTLEKNKEEKLTAHILECLRTISVPANLLPAWTIMKACCCGRPHTCNHILQIEHLPLQF